KANEHACYTVIGALRAAAMGAPFMPVVGLKAGDLLKENDSLTVIPDPFGGYHVPVVKAIVPDVAILHVQEADADGNAVILGPKYEDVLMSRAAKTVIVTAERILPSRAFRSRPEAVDIPGFLVAAVVHAPRGAAPCSCDRLYEADAKALERFRQLKAEDIGAYLAEYERSGRAASTDGGWNR